MNSIDWKKPLEASLWGVGNACAVAPVTVPLDIIKTRLLCSKTPMNTPQVIRQMWQEGGVAVFYRTFPYEFSKTVLRQAYVWPLMTTCPQMLQDRGVENDLAQKILVGVIAATVDAVVITPLERARVQNSLHNAPPISIQKFYKNGWSGFATYWTKRSVGSSTFWIAQGYFREKNRKGTEDLTAQELIKTGVEVACVVGLVLVPFDGANTLKLGQGVSPLTLFSPEGLKRACRGAHLSVAAMVINNTASVCLAEKLTRRSSSS